MARKLSGLAARLADFLSVDMSFNRQAAQRRRIPPNEKRKLASQLLETLSLQVLAVTGYRERRTHRREMLATDRTSTLKPIGDSFARPRVLLEHHAVSSESRRPQ